MKIDELKSDIEKQLDALGYAVKLEADEFGNYHCVTSVRSLSSLSHRSEEKAYIDAVARISDTDKSGALKQKLSSYIDEYQLNF